ncbi:mucin TcMUC [Trypanosoma cruzi]|nr:mucin TcMUC [Trypanosoma cruzi]
MNEGRRQLSCFCDEYWLQFPWTSNLRGVRGSFLFNCYFAFVLLCALHLLLCVCVPSVRGADTTDRSRRMCMRWSIVCRSCLLLPLPSVCWCCGRAVCAAYGACLAVALSSCGVPSVCVCRTSRLPCCSPCPSLCR